MGGKFNFSPQDSDLEYSFERTKLSDKKLPLINENDLDKHIEQKISILEEKKSVSGIVFDTVIMAAKAKIIQGLLKVMAICQAF